MTQFVTKSQLSTILNKVKNYIDNKNAGGGYNFVHIQRTVNTGDSVSEVIDLPYTGPTVHISAIAYTLGNKIESGKWVGSYNENGVGAEGFNLSGSTMAFIPTNKGQIRINADNAYPNTITVVLDLYLVGKNI